MKTVHFYILLTLNRIHSIHNINTQFRNKSFHERSTIRKRFSLTRFGDSSANGLVFARLLPHYCPTEGVATANRRREREREGKNDTKQSHPVASFSVAASFIAPDKCVSTGRFVAASFVPAFAQPQAVASERIRKSRWNRNQDGEGAAHRDSLSSYFRRISTGDLVNGDEDRSDSKNGGENRGG